MACCCPNNKIVSDNCWEKIEGRCGRESVAPVLFEDAAMDDKDQSIQLTNHLTDRDLRRMSRRELLKLTPILAVGALALPPFNERLLKTGLQLTDRGSQGFFNRNRLARTFSDAEVTPIEKFPVNSYSDYNPENDLVGWTLTVEGMVARPGEYSLDQIKSLP